MADVATAPTSQRERAWFAEGVTTLLPELYGTAVRLCRDRTDAEDLVAEAVAKAWAARGTLRYRSAFRGWLFRIMTNTYISMYRSGRGQPDVEPVPTTDDRFSLFEHLHQPILLWWGNPEQDFLNGLLRQDLVRAIDGLPDPLRAAIVLVDVQALSYRDAAAALGVPVGTVRSRLARGRSLLQKALWDEARDAGLRAATSPPSAGRTTDDDTA